MDPEHVVASFVALLFLIIAIRKAQRFRFLSLYLFLKRGNVISQMLYSRPELKDYKSEEEGEKL